MATNKPTTLQAAAERVVRELHEHRQAWSDVKSADDVPVAVGLYGACLELEHVLKVANSAEKPKPSPSVTDADTLESIGEGVRAIWGAAETFKLDLEGDAYDGVGALIRDKAERLLEQLEILERGLRVDEPKKDEPTNDELAEITARTTPADALAGLYAIHGTAKLLGSDYVDRVDDELTHGRMSLAQLIENEAKRLIGVIEHPTD